MGFNPTRLDNRRHAQLLHTLRGMCFKQTRFDPNVWVKGHKGGYNHISMKTYDILFVAKKPPSIFEKLKEIYMIKEFGAPKIHLGCDYTKSRRELLLDESWVTQLRPRNICGRSAHSLSLWTFVRRNLLALLVTIPSYIQVKFWVRNSTIFIII